MSSRFRLELPPMGHHIDPDFWRRMKWYQNRIRTHEWSTGQIVSFLDIPGFKKLVIKALYLAEIDNVDKFMTTPDERLIEILQQAKAVSNNRGEARQKIDAWRRAMIEQYTAATGKPPPAEWIKLASQP